MKRKINGIRRFSNDTITFKKNLGYVNGVLDYDDSLGLSVGTLAMSDFAISNHTIHIPSSSHYGVDLGKIVRIDYEYKDNGVITHVTHKNN